MVRGDRYYRLCVFTGGLTAGTGIGFALPDYANPGAWVVLGSGVVWLACMLAFFVQTRRELREIQQKIEALRHYRWD